MVLKVFFSHAESRLKGALFLPNFKRIKVAICKISADIYKYCTRQVERFKSLIKRDTNNMERFIQKSNIDYIFIFKDFYNAPLF